jgi:HlyD family secretion protein
MRKMACYVALLAVGATLNGCSSGTESEAEPVVPVQVAKANTEPIRRIVTADGVLWALTQSSLTPKITSPVQKFLVDRGDHVRAGELLAVLENSDLKAAVADAKGAYEQAAASYRNLEAATVPDEMVKAEADLQAAKESMDAGKTLLDSRTQLYHQGALARKLVDEAAVSYAQAKGLYDTAQKHLNSLNRVGRQEEVKVSAAQLDSAKARYDAALAQLSYSEIRSPVNGVVADRAVFPGEIANAGVPLLTVMDVSSVIARVHAPQSQAAYLRVGQPAGISLTGSTEEVKGKVTVVSPAVDPQSTTVEIWVQAPNPGESLRPGGTVQVSIMAGTIQSAVVVPAAALLPAAGGGTAVMVVGPDSVAHEHRVQEGVRDGDRVQILSGISPGNEVVVSGGVGLEDGTKVRVGQPGEATEKAGGHE